MQYPSLETKAFTIELQLWKDGVENDFYYIAVCPELNLNITTDTQLEAVEDMKEVVRDVIENLTEEQLLGYGIKMVPNFDLDNLIFDVRASGYNKMLA